MNAYLEQYRREHLRAAQMKMLHILEETARICDRHGIDYWLDGGTLLGAVRHGGFIPWDDDVDISMRSEDLQRFVEIAPAELPKDLMLQTPETDPSVKGRKYKVRDLNSFFADGDDDNRAPYEKGLFVDIFPFVPYPGCLHGLVRKMARSLCITNFKLHAPHYYSWRSTGELLYFGVKRAGMLLLWNAMRPLCRGGKYTCSYPYYNWYGTIYRTDSLFPLSTITFEGKTFRAPHDTDAYLTSIYGDYRRMPPPEKRTIHSLFFLPELIAGKEKGEKAEE